MANISEEKKYHIADTMVGSFRNLINTERNKAFGVIINAPIRLNGRLTTISQAFSEEDAIHITNLTLMRIYDVYVPEISL